MIWVWELLEETDHLVSDHMKETPGYQSHHKFNIFIRDCFKTSKYKTLKTLSGLITLYGFQNQQASHRIDFLRQFQCHFLLLCNVAFIFLVLIRSLIHHYVKSSTAQKYFQSCSMTRCKHYSRVQMMYMCLTLDIFRTMPFCFLIELGQVNTGWKG